MPIRITGLNSGLDTEAIISALVSSYNYKTEKYKKAQTKLLWKQDAWKNLNTKIYSLYTSVSNLRFSNAYNLKTATVSDSTKISVSAGSSAVNGSYSVQVTSLAKAGYLTGGKLDAGTSASTKLSELKVGNSGTKFSGTGSFSVSVGGKTTDINVTEDTTIQEVVNQLKDAGVNASYDANNRRIFVSAKETGEANDFSLSGSDAIGTNALNALGLNVASKASQAEYEALAEYADMSLDDMKAIVADKLAAKNSNALLTTQNANYQKAISYAKAKKEVDDVAAGKDADEFELLKKLATENSFTSKYVDDDGNIYKYTLKTNTYSTTKELTGGTYDEATQTYTDADGKQYSNVDCRDGKYYVEVKTSDGTGLVAADKKYEELAKSFGLIVSEDKDGKTVENKEALNAFKKNLSTIDTVETAAEKSTSGLQELLEEADAAIEAGTDAEFATRYESEIETNKATIESNKAILAEDEKLTADMTDADVEAFAKKVAYAKDVVDGNIDLSDTYNTGASRIEGTSATIWVNDAEYTSDSNVFSINGMTITATGLTGTTYDPTGASAVNATVNTDVQGIYDKIKDFLSQYNSLINEMNSLYNADSAKGYEPLTDEEKDAMSDTEIEKWEEKIKEALLRRDGTLSGVMSAMTSAMAKGVQVNGKNYYLADFGIKTLGFLNAPKNQHNAYHIDGDADDVNTAGNTDKLMAAITEDPDTVLEFMQGLAKNLYSAVDSKMKSTTLSSMYTVYNDKEMATEYSDYTSLIRKWQERLEAKEEYYYKQFAAMETALSKLNSQTSSMTGLFG